MLDFGLTGLALHGYGSSVTDIVANTLDLLRDGAVGFIDWLDPFNRPNDDEKANQSSCDDPARDHIWRVAGFRAALRKINHETEGESVEGAGGHRGPPSGSCGQGKSCKKRNQDAFQCSRAEDLPFVWLLWLKKNAHAVQCAEHRANNDYG
jgi:hypothetical protein